jgi:archaellum component FlaC
VAVPPKDREQGENHRANGNPTAYRGGNSNMTESTYSVIEKKISDLAEMVIALKKEKASLAAQLKEKEAQVKDLTREFAELTKERNSIRDKVETILARIESIEL